MPLMTRYSTQSHPDSPPPHLAYLVWGGPWLLGARLLCRWLVDDRTDWCGMALVISISASSSAFGNLCPVGRNDLPLYNYQNHSILTARYAAKAIRNQSTDKWAIKEVNIGDNYLVKQRKNHCK